jgi:hypothetical protein
MGVIIKRKLDAFAQAQNLFKRIQNKQVSTIQ